jgi:DNA-directed RNA polymerase specialized sigma24 family protein
MQPGLNGVTKGLRAALFLLEVDQNPLKVRGDFLTHHSLPSRRAADGMREPGAFQRALLRAFELPKTYRDVFLLTDIQGYTLPEIASMLRISIRTAQSRLDRARREIGSVADCAGIERAR